jgi:protein SCO1/2
MNRRAMMKPRLALLALVPLLVALAGCDEKKAEPVLGGTNLQGAAIGGDFALKGRDGKTVSPASFKGKYLIVYFGFTFCPDACPTDVAVMMKGYRLLAKQDPKAAAMIQPIFISIDPARDTPAKVGEFADAFGPPLIGLTGTPEQVSAVARAYKVYYARGEDMPGGYTMDHSRIAYLIGPGGKPIEGLPIERGPQAVAGDLAAAVEFAL